MAVRWCCCEPDCTSTHCGEVLSDCASDGMPIPAVSVTACVRVPGCVEKSCRTFKCEFPEGTQFIYLSGCSPCQAGTACWPCMHTVSYGGILNGAEIVETAANPVKQNAQCALAWSDGWEPNESSPCPELGQNTCYTPTLVEAGCAILTYQTVCRAGTITGPWLDCAGNAAGAQPTNAYGRYGWPCQDPTSCCAGNSEGCIGCHSIQHGAEVALGGVTDPKLGIVYARILSMIPCGGPEGCGGAGMLCGCGCPTHTTEDGYSYLTIQFRAIIPTDAIATAKVYTHGCYNATYSESWGATIMPVATHPEGDEDGFYRCYEERNIVVTFRKCRPASYESLENKCRMATGTYEVVRIGIGSCPNDLGCDPVAAYACDDPNLLAYVLQRGGWTFTVTL